MDITEYQRGMLAGAVKALDFQIYIAETLRLLVGSPPPHPKLTGDIAIALVNEYAIIQGIGLSSSIKDRLVELFDSYGVDCVHLNSFIEACYRGLPVRLEDFVVGQPIEDTFDWDEIGNDALAELLGASPCVIDGERATIGV